MPDYAGRSGDEVGNDVDIGAASFTASACALPSKSVGRASSTLYRPTAWASIPGVPATTPVVVPATTPVVVPATTPVVVPAATPVRATTPSVGCASSTLYCHTLRALLAMLSIDRRERFNSDRTNTANRYNHFRR
jgi:hypothetical protein